MDKEELQVINNGINNVPDKTVAIFYDDTVDGLRRNSIEDILQPSTKKREWFTPHFYRCLPLAIGNQYGFTISSEFDIEFNWNGGDNAEDIYFGWYEDQETLSKKWPRIESHFGSGIITINPPFTLRTPPGVNLITINPPNHVVPNITVMTGVVETDNIRRNFTFNLKIQMPDITVKIPKGTPLAAFIPVPRYFSDSFDLKFAEDIFSDQIIIEENQAASDASLSRSEVELKTGDGTGKHYMFGKDVYGNEFKDHQRR